MSQLECKNITIGYEKDVVVSDVSFSVEKGEYISIVGENGTGKSSILKSILGLIPIKSGEIEFEDRLLKSHIGYLSQQNPMHKEFPASVYEVVLSGCQNSKGLSPFYSKKSKAMARKNIIRLGMEEYIKKSFADLSGGQKQRVLLARALCATEKMILLDEPVTGLDPIAIREMYTLVERLNRDFNITIIMVTHDIEKALEYSDRILHLSREDYFFGTVEEYRSSKYFNELKGEVN